MDKAVKDKKELKNIFMNKLVLGNKATDFIIRLYESKEDIFKMFYLSEEKSLSDTEKNLFWYKNKDIAVYLFIFSLAKFYFLSKSKREIEKLKLFIIHLQAYYLDFYKKEIVEEPLLNGREIMDTLGLPSGKEIGYIKEKLLNEQLKGRIKNKEEALDFVKRFRGRDFNQI